MYISRDEFVLINNVFKEYDEIEDKIRNMFDVIKKQQYKMNIYYRFMIFCLRGIK